MRLFLLALAPLLISSASGGAPTIRTTGPPPVFKAQQLSDLCETLPFNGARLLGTDSSMGLDSMGLGFQKQAESWLQTLWAAIRAKLPPALAALAPAANASSTCTTSGGVLSLSPTVCEESSWTGELDLASLFGRVGVPRSFSWHPETLIAGLWNVSVPVTHISSNGMTIMSGGNRDPHGSHAAVIENHRAFAQSRGYSYWWHGAGMQPAGWQPYWSKIAQLRKRMVRFYSMLFVRFLLAFPSTFPHRTTSSTFWCSASSLTRRLSSGSTTISSSRTTSSICSRLR